ncbi:MAG: GNAT family N-acetyltransferase [Alphaproteobacteria bacterium]|nr:GNAT family N-acetyltransferase [Alphaproteobacteria bacterium]
MKNIGSEDIKERHLNENIAGKNIKLVRPSFNTETAQKIISIIDKCREVFLPWLDWVADTKSMEDSLLFLEKVDKDWQDDNQFVYEIMVDNNFIGLISVINVSWQHKKAEIGYWLDTDYTGKGYMSQAVLLIEKELFGKGFNKIVIHTDVLNIKSAAIPKRLGYKLDGILRQDVYSKPNHRFRYRNVFSKLKSDTVLK